MGAFGFNPDFTAIIKMLYCDIERVLKISGGLSAPFHVQREVRQGFSLYRMMYSLSIEPLLHNLKKSFTAVCLPQCCVSFKLSCYADDVVVLINSQNDISILERIVIVRIVTILLYFFFTNMLREEQDSYGRRGAPG